MPSDFHKAPKAWSQIKHQIYGKYLSLFLGKLGLTQNPIYCVDAFAGQGRLDDGTDGSPLVAAKLAANPRQRSRQGLLRCINVEKDRAIFENLERATAQYVTPGLVRNYHGAFEEVLDEILKVVANSTAFFFIDPFGTKGAEIRTLQRIAERNGKSEVLVRYDDTRVKRLISWAANNLEDEKNKKTALGLQARVEQLTDEQAASKAELELLFETNVETRDMLIEGYISQVKKKTKFKYGLKYPIRNPLTGGHRYYLVHFCAHRDGYTHMAHFMAQAERTYQNLVSKSGDLFRSGTEQMEFMPIQKELAEQEESESIREISRRLPEIIANRGWSGKRIENREIYAAIVDVFGWGVIRKEYLKALRGLEDVGKIQMANTDDGGYTIFQ